MSRTTHLGSKLSELREEAKLSLRDVAAETGVNDSLLSKMENGLVKQPTQENFDRLAQFYGIDAEELYTLAGYKIATNLPGYGPYLRTRYDLPAEAVDELRSHFEYIKQKYEDTDA